MPARFHTPEGFARFYAPLAATSLLLTSTNPLLTAVVARSSDPLSALAGYLVAFSLSGVLYSPLLVIQQVVATRMLEGGRLAPVRRFALVIGGLFTAIAVAIAFFDPLSELVFGTFLAQTDAAFEEAVAAMRFLSPVPLLTAIRATHQGRLVAGHRTHPIAAATGARTGVLALAAFTLVGLSSGAWIGAAAFTAALAVEAFLVAFAKTPELQLSLQAEGSADTMKTLLRFSCPLILNVLLWWSTPLLINVALARTATPELNISAFGIVEAVVWFLASPVGQLQHASIALVNGVDSHKKVRGFAMVVALGTFVPMAILALPAVWPPILSALYRPESGLLLNAGAALPIAVLYPFLYGHRQYYQGLFIRAGQPGTVGMGAVLRIASIVVAAALFLSSQGDRGAVFGVSLVVLGLGIEGSYLMAIARSRSLPGPVGTPPVQIDAASTGSEAG